MINNERFQILSLDGGGLKGIFTISLLVEIEKHLAVDLIDHFDLIAGTSTGGIIALALGLGYKPVEILDFYLQEGDSIFPQRNDWRGVLRQIEHWIRPVYSQQRLQRSLKKYFGDRRLGESRKRLIIPAFDGGRGDVHIFKTSHHPHLKVDYKEMVWKIATATSSAPTYFEAYINDGGSRLIDGGIWANNPSMIALTEALGYLDRTQGHIYMLSIGTTSAPHTFGRHHEKGGKLLWADKAVEFCMHGQSISAHNQAWHLLGEERYFRIDPVVCGGKFQLDKLSKELVGLGQSVAREQLNHVEQRFLGHRAGEFEPDHKL